MNLNEAHKILDNLKSNSDDIEYEIENPKGSKKVFVNKSNPYPIKTMIYPVDYGYIKNNYMAEDGAELDLFVGNGNLFGYFVVFRPDIPKETKMIYKCTKSEVDSIIAAFKPVILNHSSLRNEKEFIKFIQKFKGK